MRENNGWIKLHRKIEDWCWFGDPNTFVVFIHLLIMANVEDKRWRTIVIKRGSLVTSRGILAKRVGISVQQTRTSIDKLISTNEITKLVTPNYTVISINNYEQYQKSTKSLTNEQPTSNQRVTTTKEYKNIRSKEGESYDPTWGKEICSKYSVKESDVIELWDQMVNSRIANGKPYKDWKRGFIAWLLPSIKEGKIIKVISKKEKMIKEAQEVGFDLSIFNLPKENA